MSSDGELPVPPSLLNPSAVWVFNFVVPIVGALIIFKSVLDSIRTKRLTWGFLFLFNSLGVYWMETIGDWGQHLIYSPVFQRHHLLDWLPLKTPNDPLFMPFTYAVYWTVHSVMLMQLGYYLAHKTNFSVLTCVVVLSLPLNYAFDILVEGFAVYMGWWTYDPGFGPVILFANGGQQPLTWPILLMTGWPNMIAYWGGKPPLHSLNIIERVFRLERYTQPKPIGEVPEADLDTNEDPEAEALVGEGFSRDYESTSNASKSHAQIAEQELRHRKLTHKQRHDAQLDYTVIEPRWKFELRRLGAWFVVFQVSFFIMLIIPLLAMRIATGKASPYIRNP